MTNKTQFLEDLGELMKKHIYRLNIKKFEYLKTENGEEFAVVWFNTDFQKKIRITGDSELAIMQDIARHIS